MAVLPTNRLHWWYREHTTSRTGWANPSSLLEYSSQSRLIGVFGDLTLGYRNFAFIHATGRNDWTSLLSPANRSFFYPSVDATVILSELVPSLKTSSILSYAKVRAGYAKVGQVNVLPYQLQNVFNPASAQRRAVRRFPTAVRRVLNSATGSMTRT